MSKLTEKKKRFADEYLKKPNGKKAAIKAGFSKKTAEAAASRLLRNVKVQEYMDIKREKLEKKTELDQIWVLNNLKKVFERCMQEEAVNDREGNFTGVFEFESSGANKSLELIGKHLGMFKDKIEHTGKDGKPIEHDVKTTITTELINERIKNILGRE